MSFFQNPRIVLKADGSVGEYVKVADAGSSGFKKGELVYVASGRATACVTGATYVLGIAQEDSAAVATSKPSITVEVIRPGDEVEIVTGTTITYAMQGVGYGLAVSSNKWTVDLTDTTNDAVTLVRPALTFTGAYQKLGIFKFLPHVCQGSYQVG